MQEFMASILAAVVGAIFLGSYIAFVRISSLSASQFLLIQLIAAALATIPILLYTKELFTLDLREVGYPVIAGVMFSVALALVFYSIKLIGIGASSSVYIGLQLVIAAVIGFLLFNELASLSLLQRLETVGGVTLVLAGIVLISVAKL